MLGKAKKKGKQTKKAARRRGCPATSPTITTTRTSRHCYCEDAWGKRHTVSCDRPAKGRYKTLAQRRKWFATHPGRAPYTHPAASSGRGLLVTPTYGQDVAMDGSIAMGRWSGWS